MMEALSVRDFRNNMAASFDKAANEESVLIRRRNEIYALVKIGPEDLMLTPELQKRIDEVHRAYDAGECVTCSSHEELDTLFDSL